MPERLAVIDLGSNTFRLVVFTAGDGWWKRTDEIFEPVRIGEGLASTGSLGREPIRRALATVHVFSQFCRANGLAGDAIKAVATSAIRDAGNAADFLEPAQARRDARDPGADAARRRPTTATSRPSTPRRSPTAASSTSVAGRCSWSGSKGRVARESESFALGAVRMTERFLPDDRPAKRRELDALRAYVAGALDRVDWLTGTGRRLVGIGGTVRNLATAAQRAAGLPSIGVQGMVVTRAALDDLVERLAALPPGGRAGLPGIKSARGDLILAGAVVVATVLDVGGFDAIEATEAGLREGVFFEQHIAGESSLFDDVRHSSVVNLGRPVRGRHSRTPVTSPSSPWASSTSWRPPGSTPATRSSASCSGRQASSTTWGCRSTTTTTTSTPAT